MKVFVVMVLSLVALAGLAQGCSVCGQPSEAELREYRRVEREVLAQCQGEVTKELSSTAGRINAVKKLTDYFGLSHEKEKEHRKYVDRPKSVYDKLIEEQAEQLEALDKIITSKRNSGWAEGLWSVLTVFTPLFGRRSEEGIVDWSAAHSRAAM